MPKVTHLKREAQNSAGRICSLGKTHFLDGRGRGDKKMPNHPESFRCRKDWAELRSHSLNPENLQLLCVPEGLQEAQWSLGQCRGPAFSNIEEGHEIDTWGTRMTPLGEDDQSGCCIHTVPKVQSSAQLQVGISSPRDVRNKCSESQWRSHGQVHRALTETLTSLHLLL